MAEIDTLKQQMFNIRLELERVSKSNVLKEAERIERDKRIKELTEEYKKVKKQFMGIKLEERKIEDAKHKR